MRSKWIIPSSVALVALISVIFLSQLASQALVPAADLEVVKSVSPEAIAPDELVVYEVVLNNTTAGPLVVSSLVDTLPPDFDYVDLAWDSEWGVDPWDTTPPDVQWSGPITVPVSGLTLRYNVHVPGSVALRAEPYTNTVVADVGGTLYEGEAGLLVAVGEVSVDKSATQTRVEPGEVATYTVTFNNSGYVARDLDMVVDELPPDVSFKRMTDDSDVTVGFSPGTTGTLVWLPPPPLSIPPQGELVVEYEVTMPVVSDTVTLVNEAWGQLDSTTVGPDSVEVKVGQTGWVYFPSVMQNYAPPRFTVSKTAYPEVVFSNVAEAPFTYTVAFYNEGTVPGVLEEIRDTLPGGFEFDGMVTGESDVDDGPPPGTTGEIAWTGPFTVDGESSLTLVYRVTSAPTLGTYVNSATATTVEGKGRAPQTPGQATVHISEPLYLEEDWEDPSPHWEPFLNYWRLNWEQWHMGYGQGVGGSTALKHTYHLGVDDPGDGAHDALYMYLDPEAEEWTDYRYEVKTRLADGGGALQGLWVRGKYRESEFNRRHV
ncbi:hypothetical protein ACFLTC_03125, partial [Chloroflexota bacterium]